MHNAKVSIFAVLICVLGLESLALPQDLSLPKDQGIFYKAGETWTRMGQAYASDLKAKFSLGGWVKSTSDQIFIFDNAESETQLAAGKQVFNFVYPARGAEAYRKVHDVATFEIWRLDKKGDHREMIFKGSTLGGTRADKKHVIAITVERVSDGLTTITPVTELTPGEYIVVVQAKNSPQPPLMFEFGIKGRQ